ncbi:MlaD family protein [Streptomyces sanyensis]|uniref:MlaD family protein n=1 Tax=Streptomyces sanyensis TaxID=568869 RepID=A0ABP8ZQ63_9ACTN
MVTAATRLKNLAFLLVAVLALGFLGLRYADLGPRLGLRDHYTVRVQLPATGGLFTHSDVTYRGVSVGRVGAVELTDDGVEAELRIKDSAPPIPADLQAVVAGLSAVGEQYIDLRPARSAGPHLADGSVIDRSRTRIPEPVTTVLTSVDALASSVDTESLRTVVEELGSALQGRGDDLQVLLDSGGHFVRAADRALPATTGLLADGETVLRTQIEQGRALRGFARGAAELAATLKESDTDLRRLIATAPAAAGQLSALLRDLDPSFGVVVANLLTTSELAVTRQRGIEELLVKLPAVAAAGATAVTPEGASFGLSVTFFEPLPCTAGYQDTAYRNGLDTGPAPVNTRARCTAPASTGTGVRGSAHAPDGGGVPDPARPGVLPDPGRPGTEAAPLPGVLGLPALTEGPTGMRGLLGLLGPEGGR